MQMIILFSPQLTYSIMLSIVVQETVQSEDQEYKQLLDFQFSSVFFWIHQV